jgi:hypothetical protein
LVQVLLHMTLSVHHSACLHRLPMHLVGSARPFAQSGPCVHNGAHPDKPLCAYQASLFITEGGNLLACHVQNASPRASSELSGPELRGGCAARCAACAMRSSSARRRSWPAARLRRTTCSAARCGCWARWPRCAWRACVTAACSAGRSPAPPLLTARSPQEQLQGRLERAGCRAACGALRLQSAWCHSTPGLHACLPYALLEEA